MTNSAASQRDLVVLTADKNAQFAIKGILARPMSIGIRAVHDPEFLVHPAKDPGVLNRPEALLRTYLRTHRHALVVMDREGSGGTDGRESMEPAVEKKLQSIGWGNRARAVVIEPELDAWVWSESPHVEKELGWRGREPSLREWLAEKSYVTAPHPKPTRPKEALEAALRIS